jgi:tetratricopeptide (TPR) repeat protein
MVVIPVNAWIRQAVPPCRSPGRLAAKRLSKGFLLCASMLFSLTPSLRAQHSGSASSNTPGWPLHNSAPDHALPDAVGIPLPNVEERDESCLLWTFAEAQTQTVNAATLEVPGKARGEFKKGCSDLRGRKLAGAEKHLREAIQEYPRYTAAWVLLGQVLEAGNRIEEARGACSEASSVDSSYAPAYLCLADTAGQQRQWVQSLDSANRALVLAPAHNLYGNFYSAMALFHLRQFPAAERNALETIDADHLHRVPQAHLLLAQIYGAKHDFPGAAVQLRTYLKVAPKSPDSDAVRKSLAELESQISKQMEK